MENEAGLPPQGLEGLEKNEERAGGAGAPTAAGGAAASTRMEVSAQTIARMMGIASATDLQLLEGRLDLLASRVSTLMMKVDKVLSSLSTLASAGDIGRLETQIGSIKSMLRDAVDAVGTLQSGQPSAAKEGGESQGKKLRDGIRSSSES
jgi:hypothetical protein